MLRAPAMLLIRLLLERLSREAGEIDIFMILMSVTTIRPLAQARRLRYSMPIYLPPVVADFTRYFSSSPELLVTEMMPPNICYFSSVFIAQLLATAPIRLAPLLPYFQRVSFLRRRRLIR